MELYIHVPFCGSKCIYCAFSSYVPQKALRQQEVLEWLAALETEAAWRLDTGETDGRFPLGERAEFDTVFVGGGTPTFLSESELERLMDRLESYYSYIPVVGQEVTVEANPDSLTPAKVDILRQHGVNRVSLGVQSLDDDLLAMLGRQHRCTEVRQAVTVLREHGLTNINFDLMFGLPGQDMKTWICTVKEAVAMEPKHLSLYGLSVEAGTPLARRLKHDWPSGAAGEAGVFEKTGVTGTDRCYEFMPLPDDDTQGDMYEWAVHFLAEQGYERYETSNFAREGFTCRHNQAIWRGEDYVGLGPSAVSTQGNRRRTNISDLASYVDGIKHAVADREGFTEESALECPGALHIERLTKVQQMSEYMILGLRTAQGVSFDGFRRKFGVALEDIFGHVLLKYSQDRVLGIEADRVFMYPQYFFVANTVLYHFIL